MKLIGLRDLYKSMKHQNIERYKFEFTFRKVQFDVLYFIDETPNILAFGTKKQNFYFEIPVNKGFVIKPFINNLNEFCRIMGFKYDPGNRFKPTVFFNEFNTQVPITATPKNIPKPSQIAVYRNQVEEADKVYFIGWRENNKVGHKVSLENLKKTRQLLSYQAYVMCKTKNISSRWSPYSSDEKTFTLPT